MDGSGRNLGVYRGILTLVCFSKFNEFLDKRLERLRTDDTFQKCLSLSKGDASLPAEEVGTMFSGILAIPNEDERYRDVLMGCLFGSLWPFMNAPQNFARAVEYGVAMTTAAFSVDHLVIRRKLKLAGSGTKVINLAGSGKKKLKLLNISSMAAIVLAATGRKIRENIVVAKTVARATSSATGSSDIFELAGVNLKMPIEEMAEISLKTGIGLFDINTIVPILNHVYDGRLHNVQAFAGLVGGAAIVNPVDADLINYGLTRGSTALCLAILRELCPSSNIVVMQGNNAHGTPVIDQISITGNTELAQNIDGETTVREIAPEDFGLDFKSSTSIESTPNRTDNLNEFIKILMGRGNKELKRAVALDVALNLFSLKMVDDLRAGAALALETIDSGAGIEVLDDLVVHSGGDIHKLKGLVKNSSTLPDSDCAGHLRMGRG
jgi:anthranilate phosphoribosyltransferase